MKLYFVLTWNYFNLMNFQILGDFRQCWKLTYKDYRFYRVCQSSTLLTMDVTLLLSQNPSERFSRVQACYLIRVFQCNSIIACVWNFFCWEITNVQSKAVSASSYHKKYFVMWFIILRMKNDTSQASRGFFVASLFSRTLRESSGFNFHHFTWSFLSNTRENIIFFHISLNLIYFEH